MAGNNQFQGLFKLLHQNTPESIACATSDLHKAATTGDLSLLQACLEKDDVNINLEDERGNTPLFMATLKGHRTAVDMLLQKGAAVNDTSCSPIHYARDIHIAKALVEAGVRIGDRNFQGDSPLHRAVAREDNEVVFFFIEQRADTSAKNAEGATPLHSSCQHKIDGPICEVIRKLIAAGADVNVKDKAGKTPLHHACECLSMFDSIAILLKHGADLRMHDMKGYCPIHYLISTFLSSNTDNEHDFINKLDMMLTNQETINLKTLTGLNALHIAASFGLCIVIKHLVQKGCDILCQDGRGKSVLHLVSSVKEERNVIETIQTLISCGSNVNCCDFWGYTPLHEAIANGKRDVIEILLSNGADIQLPDNNGTTALHLAAASCHEALPLLLSRGATVNATNKYLSTPLHFSAWAGSMLAVETLIKSGANQKMKDLSEYTPHDTAVFTCSEVAEILESEKTSHPVKAFSNYANKYMSKNDFENLVCTDENVVRVHSDFAHFCNIVFQTPRVGHVVFRDEAQEIQSAVESVAENIAKQVAELDPIFKSTVLRAGSSSENTKTKFPNEFDFMFCLEEFSNNTYPELQERDEARVLGSEPFSKRTSAGGRIGDLVNDLELIEEHVTVSDYTKIYVKDTVDAEPLLDLSERDSRLVPCYMMFHRFSQLLTRVLLGENFPKHPNLLIQEVTLEPALLLQWRGSVYKVLDINVDLVPAIRLPCWPEKIRRDYKLLTSDILSIPGMAVSKMAGESFEDLWRCSMSLQETAIFRKLRPHIRNSYTTAKAFLNSNMICPVAIEEETEETAFIRQFASMPSMDDSDDAVFITSAESAIPSYFLKMMFLFSLEDKVEKEGLESVYAIDSQMSSSSNAEECVTVIYERKSNTDHGSCSPPSKRKRPSYSYGPAEVRNMQQDSTDIDINLVREIYRRCEVCLSERKVPSFFNPNQNVLGSRAEELRLEIALNYVKFINKLIKD
ncbi:uncharacterized protein [Argopecten irradians]|uniref:uncharacterized protein n=1 Tax=Argopecten irradians TaxID=31199 RepID=UPI003715F8F3